MTKLSVPDLMAVSWFTVVVTNRRRDLTKEEIQRRVLELVGVDKVTPEQAEAVLRVAKRRRGFPPDAGGES